ncbi:MAG: cellulose synthase operon protein YhjQ/BcsQ [Alphaproteobacteria bacterium]
MTTVLEKVVKDTPAGHAEIVAFVTDQTTVEAVRAVLAELKLEDESSVQRGDAASCVEYLKASSSPRLIIADVSGSDLPLSQVHTLAEVCEPRVRVVIIGEQNDVGLFRELMQLGVSDYVVKPITAELMQRAILVAEGKLQASAQGQRSGKVIAVNGARGGAGTTTLVANVGWLLADRNRRRVSLVDLDLHNGALGLMLDVRPTNGLREALEHADRIDELFVDRLTVPHSERLSIICGEEPLYEHVAAETGAADALFNVLRHRSHYIIVDLPRRTDPVFQHITAAADIRIIVADQTLASVRDVMRQLSAAREDANPAQRTMLVVNQRSQPCKGDVPIEEMERALGRKVDHVIPFGRGGVTAAGNLGEPATNGRSAVTDAIHAIVADLSGGTAEIIPFWKKLLRSA